LGVSELALNFKKRERVEGEMTGGDQISRHCREAWRDPNAPKRKGTKGLEDARGTHGAAIKGGGNAGKA